MALIACLGVLEKHGFAEVPPRVEYDFTPFGLNFVETFRILDELEASLALARKP